MVAYLSGRESILDAIYKYEHPGQFLQQRMAVEYPLYNSSAGPYNGSLQPFVLRTSDDIPIANLINGPAVPSHVIGFRTVDYTDINSNSAPFYPANSYGGGKLGIYSYWNTCGQMSAPIPGINDSLAPNQYEFYNYSQHPQAGGGLPPNPQEIGNNMFDGHGQQHRNGSELFRQLLRDWDAQRKQYSAGTLSAQCRNEPWSKYPAGTGRDPGGLSELSRLFIYSWQSHRAVRKQLGLLAFFWKAILGFMPILRPKRELPPALDKKVANYVLATTGLALGQVQSVSAAVVYTPAKEIRETQQSYRPVYATIDVNHDGQIDFDLIGSLGSESGSFGLFRYASVGGGARPGNQFGVAASTFNFSPIAQALQLGQEVGPNLKFSNAGLLGAFFSVGEGPQSAVGQFYNQRNKFLALKFAASGETYYGWARVSVQPSGGGKIAFELVDYAYQSTPNLPILAGQGIPKPETARLLDFDREAPVGCLAKSQQGPALGLLAYGSDALPLWRK